MSGLIAIIANLFLLLVFAFTVAGTEFVSSLFLFLKKNQNSVLSPMVDYLHI